MYINGDQPRPHNPLLGMCMWSNENARIGIFESYLDFGLCTKWAVYLEYNTLREYGSTLYVGLTHPAPSTNTNFPIMFLLN